jgi:hypothetical protein
MEKRSAADSHVGLIWAHLKAGGGGKIEQIIESSIDPGQPQAEEMIESILAPAHTNPLEALLDEPFAGALYFDNGTLAESSSRRSGGP